MNPNTLNILASDLWDICKQHGLDILTSESCGYSMRLLCDITQEFEAILASFLGGNIQFNQVAWNGSNGSLHSVMLTRSTLNDLSIYILLEEGYTEIVHYSGESIGCRDFIRCYKSQDDQDNEYKEFPWLKNAIVKSWHNWSGHSRNLHHFSGRLE